MGNSIPRFTTTCHNKRSNSLPPLPPDADAAPGRPISFPLMIIATSAYESGKRTFYSLHSANSSVSIALSLVGVYWLEATSVALRIALPTGVCVTRG